MNFSPIEKKPHLIQTPRRAHRPRRLAGYAELSPKPPYVSGYLQVEDRLIPRAATELSLEDRWGAVRMRWGAGRSSYAVMPGLYSVGSPDPNSPLLLSANYKLSFDLLRSALGGLDAWILVLDTKGINVWCAAGKGSFGTAELLEKIQETDLRSIIRHNQIIAPQLGAPGLAAPEIARKAGFKIIWGPVRAEDIPAFLKAGMRKDESMRTVNFKLFDRLILAPIELVQAWPLFAVAAALALLAALPTSTGSGPGFWGAFAALGGTVLAGTLIFPALLPVLPSRAFAAKGAFLGAAWGIASAILGRFGPLLGVANVLVCAPVTAFLAMNFTGASTFTCQKGAQLEVEKGILPMIITFAAGLGLAIISRATGI